MNRTATLALATVVAAAAGCGPLGETSDAERSEGGTADSAGADTLAVDGRRAQTATGRVIFQLTGLMLVAPPSDSSPGTHFMMPRQTDVAHQARLAFGVGTDPGICVPYDDQKGICWVDLAVWRLEPVSGSELPTAPDATGIPTDMINLSDVVGDSFAVNVARVTTELRADVAFLTGRARGTHCTLAHWRYRPIGMQEPKQDPFYNVLRWEVGYDAAAGLPLRFVRSTDGAVREVRLRPELGVAWVLAAHLPLPEMEDVISERVVRPTGQPDATLEHMKDLLRLLRRPGSSAGPVVKPEHVPYDATNLSEQPCPIRITGVSTNKSWQQHLFDGLSTYSCVMATGDRKP